MADNVNAIAAKLFFDFLGKVSRARSMSSLWAGIEVIRGPHRKER